LGEVGVTFYDTADVYGCGHSENIRWACEQSLRRLGTDHLDLYQFHLGGYDLEKAEDVLAVFEELVASGKVRAIGWSTDSPERAEPASSAARYPPPASTRSPQYWPTAD
jgi:aryl-alcohol dehydrogenase-like predicted oxidoreductase